MNKAREFDQSVVTELKALLGERVSTSAAMREHHGKDESYFPYALPDAVVFPATTDEVRDVVDICRRHRVPMIPFGVGTSLEGHILAINGGVSIDLSRMNNVLAVHEEDLDAVVQAGVTRKQLNEYIKHTGLFFPIDPGADATLGGMTATRASGTNAVRYGTMRENVLSLQVVLPDGRIIQTARRAKKSADHRGDATPLPGAGFHVGGGVRFPDHRRCNEERDSDPADGHSRGAQRIAVRDDHGGPQPP